MSNVVCPYASTYKGEERGQNLWFSGTHHPHRPVAVVNLANYEEVAARRLIDNAANRRWPSGIKISYLNFNPIRSNNTRITKKVCLYCFGISAQWTTSAGFFCMMLCLGGETQREKERVRVSIRFRSAVVADCCAAYKVCQR